MDGTAWKPSRPRCAAARGGPGNPVTDRTSWRSRQRPAAIRDGFVSREPCATVHVYETVSFTGGVSIMAEAATVRRSRITPEREAELYAAVLDLLREVGYDALTMDAVAARTRSSKATLYRQWGGKAKLVVRALRHQKPAAPRRHRHRVPAGRPARAGQRARTTARWSRTPR